MSSKQQAIRELRSLREAVVERRRHLAGAAAQQRESAEREGNGEPGTGYLFASEFPALQAQLTAIDEAIEEEERWPDDGATIHPLPSRSRPRGDVE
jgi:hypothetical protein